MPEQQQAAAVQPDGAGVPGVDGQGADAPGGGLYDLASAPDELRPYLEAELKKIEGNATRKFQEHAEYQKRMAPLEEMGLHDVDPEELQELLQIRQYAQDPEQFRSWWETLGEQLGYFEPDGEPGAEGEQEPPDQSQELMAKFQQMLDERLGPVEQQARSQAEEQRVEQERTAISEELSELREQHGEFDENVVCQLALAYADDDDAIAKGFADYQRLVGGAERGLLANKSDQPSAPMGGGQPASNVEEIKTFDDAKKAAMERLRAG